MQKVDGVKGFRRRVDSRVKSDHNVVYCVREELLISQVVKVLVLVIVKDLQKRQLEVRKR